jgi:carbon monoxide dehydrogenase subunit G
MHLEHEFVVPVPVTQAWEVLLDIERIAPCMPGATVDSVEGDTFTGRVKVKVGPITVTYQGTASFLERDEEARHVTIRANGREARGSGTAAATVDAVLHDEGERTRVKVDTELAVTGRPAQFGRGVMVDVSNKLLATFTDCLEQTLASGPVPAAAAEPGRAAPAPVPVEPGTAAPTAVPAEPGRAAPAAVPAEPAVATAPSAQPAERPTPEAIDLLGTAGAPVLKRVAPAVAAVGVLFLLWRVLRRIRS